LRIELKMKELALEGKNSRIQEVGGWSPSWGFSQKQRNFQRSRRVLFAQLIVYKSPRLRSVDPMRFNCWWRAQKAAKDTKTD
jgi:hypothetical protein